MSSNPSSNRRSCAKGSICIVVFEAVLKTPATMAGHGERDRCARSSLLLSEPCCVSSHCRSPMPPRLTRYRGENYCDTGGPDDGSRMTRECPVRFCERLGMKLARPTHPWPPGVETGLSHGDNQISPATTIKIRHERTSFLRRASLHDRHVSLFFFAMATPHGGILPAGGAQPATVPLAVSR